MKRRVFAFVALSACLVTSSSEYGGKAQADDPVSSLARLSPIDAHVHVFKSSPAFSQFLDRANMKLLNVSVVDKHDPGFEEAEPQHQKMSRLLREIDGRIAWCSTFDPWDFGKPGFSDQVVRQLASSFNEGAVAVKIYKDMGMELRSKSGAYVMPDDPVWRPIFDFIESQGKTLYAHIAEPTAAWKPLDPKSPHYSYYKENPDWHMYLHPERPRKEVILAARDRVLEQHPELRVVGCHLGSMEDNVDDIARRLDRYPNFAVDTAARVPDLMLQPREKVRAFLIKYQDRILYGTDLLILPNQDPDQAVERWEAEYIRDWTYFATDQNVQYRGQPIKGLALPESVLLKFYRLNAEKWVPGIKGGQTGERRAEQGAASRQVAQPAAVSHPRLFWGPGGACPPSGEDSNNAPGQVADTQSSC